MTVYSKTATPEQREWLEKYEAATTFEPMHQEDLDAGFMTFEKVAEANVRWFEDWMGDAMDAIPDIPESISKDEDHG